jgi:hypothetical protein
MFDHNWWRMDGDDGFWTCDVCRERSPTRRKPKKAGCPGKTYTDKELANLTLWTSRVPNGGLNVEILTKNGIYQYHVAHYPSYMMSRGNLIEQYIAWVNRQLDLMVNGNGLSDPTCRCEHSWCSSSDEGQKERTLHQECAIVRREQ